MEPRPVPWHINRRAAAKADSVTGAEPCPSRATSQPPVDLAASLLGGAGIAADRARLIGELLVEADLMGHTTHGLALLPGYLDELRAGTMASTGEPR